MVAIPVQQKRYSIEEYFDLEEKAIQKHEYHNGKIKTVAGGSIPHNKIAVNITRSLDNWIEEKQLPWVVLNSDTKIRIETFNRNLYPDALLVCEQIQYWGGRKDIILNPLIIFEVLSESTEEYDLEDKFRMYRTLHSFKEYVLVNQFQPLVHDYLLHDGKESLWKITSQNDMKGTIRLHSIGIDLPLREIYRQVPELQGEAWEG